MNSTKEPQDGAAEVREFALLLSTAIMVRSLSECTRSGLMDDFSADEKHAFISGYLQGAASMAHLLEHNAVMENLEMVTDTILNSYDFVATVQSFADAVTLPPEVEEAMVAAREIANAKVRSGEI